MTTVTAWEVTGSPGVLGRIRAASRPVPTPGDGEVVVGLTACGVCRTDLHLADLELAPKAPRTVPGHEGVGEVVAVGRGVSSLATGDRVGVPWLRRTCGRCRWCRTGRENLCRGSEYTGWDADGCFAEYVSVPAAYVYRIPEGVTDVDAAPLLCAGIIGYRALRRANLPPGGRLGIYGFGASGHLTAQIAIGEGAEVHVLTRGARARALATELGAASVGGPYDRPPVPLDSAITFAPVGDVVPAALAALEQGGTLAVAGIHLTAIPVLDYDAHLFRERTLTSVTANTRADGEELLRLATALGVRPRVRTFGLGHADEALQSVAAGAVAGVAVLRM